MEKDIACLEIRNKTAILTIGNVLKEDNRVNVVYKVVRPLSAFLRVGEVLDAQSLTNDIKNMLVIEDLKHNLRIKINEVILIVQPYGLEVYSSERGVTVISDNSKIGRTDISNAIHMLSKERIPISTNCIVDIIPNFFLLDGNRKFTDVPLGQNSNELTVNANIYTLPENNFKDIMDCVKKAGVLIKKVVIAPVAISQLFKSYQASLDTYVIVDCGRKTTIASFVGNNSVYSSSWINFGLDDLIDEVAAGFGILRGEAEDLINLYGLDNRTSLLNPVICDGEIEGQKAQFHLDDLNAIVSKYFRELTEKLSNCIDSLMSEYEELKENLNVLFVGEGIKINGFKQYVMKFLNENYLCAFPVLPNVGLLDSIYMNCAGGILSASIYQGSLEDTIKGTIPEPTRVIEKGQEYRETKDEL